VDFAEVERELDMEFFFERESLAYKIGRGSSGMQINAKHCPACGDGRWRTYFGVDTGRGNCFVCNESFTKVRFLHFHFGHNNDWRETGRVAAELLKEQGWRPKRIITAAVEVGEVRLPYSSELPLASGENLAYLENRGITGDYTKYFHLRWCEVGFWLYRHESGELRKQNFNDRVIIPVFDLDGTLVTFQGRDISGRSENKDLEFPVQKYLFPKMLPGTGRFLLNGQNVHLTKDVAMGEGAFDVIALKIAFDQEVSLRHVVPIGSFGKHLSYGALDGNDQLGRLLKLKAAGVERVTIMWDGEEKALTSALDAAKLITGIGMVARIGLLPPGKDPNEVPPEVTIRAYYEARTWNSKLDLKWRLQNPYSARYRRNYFSSH
jgi:DNA primase